MLVLQILQYVKFGPLLLDFMNGYCSVRFSRKIHFLFAIETIAKNNKSKIVKCFQKRRNNIGSKMSSKKYNNRAVATI